MVAEDREEFTDFVIQGDHGRVLTVYRVGLEENDLRFLTVYCTLEKTKGVA